MNTVRDLHYSLCLCFIMVVCLGNPAHLILFIEGCKMQKLTNRFNELSLPQIVSAGSMLVTALILLIVGVALAGSHSVVAMEAYAIVCSLILFVECITW